MPDANAKRFPSKRKGFTANGKGQFRAVKRQVVKALKSLSELKYTDTSMQHTSGSTATIAHLSGVAAGDTNIARSGRKIFLKSLQWRGGFLTDNDNFFGDLVRILIFKDLRQVGDTTPAATDVLESSSVYAFVNKNNAGRFMVLRDYLFNLAPAGSNGAGGTYGQSANFIPVKGYRKLKSSCMYNGDAATDIEKGGIYCLVVCDHNTAGALTAGNLNFRLRWSDT